MPILRKTQKFQDFFRKKGHGWTNFLVMVTLIHSENLTRNLNSIHGGVTVLGQGKEMSAGDWITSLLTRNSWTVLKLHTLLYDVMGSDHCPVGLDIKIKD